MHAVTVWLYWPSPQTEWPFHFWQNHKQSWSTIFVLREILQNQACGGSYKGWHERLCWTWSGLLAPMRGRLPTQKLNSLHKSRNIPRCCIFWLPSQPAGQFTTFTMLRPPWEMSASGNGRWDTMRRLDQLTELRPHSGSTVYREHVIPTSDLEPITNNVAKDAMRKRPW